MPEIRPGRYRHYKGNKYTVLGVARHSETLEELVVYRQEYGDHVETKGGWHLFPPRPWQAEALSSLAAIRRDGYSKALVAVATGLGKTWLAAFDVIAVGRELGRPPRVLADRDRGRGCGRYRDRW